MNASSRRALLASAAASALAGCFSPSNEPEGSKLGMVDAFNLHDEPHTVDVRIEWEGELVHDQSHDLRANGPEDDDLHGIVIDQTWPDETGDFVISGRADGRPWRDATPEDHDYPDCMSPYLMINQWGGFGIGVMTASKWCDDTESRDTPPSTNDSSDGTGMNQSGYVVATEAG